MKKKDFIIAGLLIIALLTIWFRRQNNLASSAEENLFRDTTHLILTNHVKCRMGCRQITIEEIKEIVQKGNVNYAKSGRGKKGDRTFALEGYSAENQHIRVVVAPENDGLVVITCIDMNREWPCNCN